ncbi:MAG: tRNA uridine-5-carboxymethylaminomethyl(34) synthesis enzyme MnmG [Myxococcota bacterium]
MGSSGRKYDVVVVGAGHAGCEAALAASRLGASVALVTLRLDGIAQMSCNPAIGGVGKGHLVREIDALGGAMGKVADATGIQFRRLNLSRGPAVRSTRAQSDSRRYREAMGEVVANAPGIERVEGEAIDLRVQGGRLAKVVLASGEELTCGAAVITTGTFLNGLCHVGEEQFAGGRVGDEPARQLSTALRRVGLTLGRFKTGTTPRLAADSIDWSRLEAQPGDEPPPRFSFDPVPHTLAQVSCHITYTETSTHDVIRQNLGRSPLFSGVIKGTGPRYCPSIEDKVVRFADKERHQIFLEPEGLDSDRVYPNGLSTSLPKDVQEAFVHSIAGLERARIVQFGYAVEYDYAPPTQLLPSLMTKAVPGLFLAGQINGTSGYEEAAAQGLMAGLNAVQHLGGAEAAVVRRDQAYIGVLIDDLVTKGVDEPYRVFTSRAEHRLTLREANAEERLWQLGARWGLLSTQRRVAAEQRDTERAVLRRRLLETRVDGAMVERLALSGGEVIGLTLAQILRRPEVEIARVLGADVETLDPAIVAQVHEEIVYEGYIRREAREIERLRELDDHCLPSGMDYGAVPGLSREVRDKLLAVQPTTLGQAGRIPGVTPAALAILRLVARRAA